MNSRESQAAGHRKQDALIAAQLYYLQDLTMDRIARELGTSRSTVSRLLSAARESGLVEITVHSPQTENRRLETSFRERFGVTAHLVPVPEVIGESERLDRVARTAARILMAQCDSNMDIGVAWGSTMTAVSRHLQEKSTHNGRVIQLNGAANPLTTGVVYASEILDRFGRTFGMSVHQFPVPAFFDDPATRRALWRERSIARVRDLQRGLDIAVFGLGSPLAGVPSHVYSRDYLDQHELAELAEAGVVGDVATVFYRADGTDEGIELNERSSGPPLDELRQAPRRVGIAAGSAKGPAISGALHAGLITDLIVDSTTARAIIDRG